jgi:hypothetical protein
VAVRKNFALRFATTIREANSPFGASIWWRAWEANFAVQTLRRSEICRPAGAGFYFGLFLHRFRTYGAGIRKTPAQADNKNNFEK